MRLQRLLLRVLLLRASTEPEPGHTWRPKLTCARGANWWDAEMSSSQGVMPFLPILMGRSVSCRGKKTNTFNDCALFHTFADRNTLHVYLGCCLGDRFVRVAE